MQGAKKLLLSAAREVTCLRLRKGPALLSMSKVQAEGPFENELKRVISFREREINIPAGSIYSSKSSFTLVQGVDTGREAGIEQSAYMYGRHLKVF